MANSLELRVPLLDHKVLEFAASLPTHYKVNGFARKYILKAALSKRVPREILHRKKAGFPVPYETWLRNEFKDFTRDILLDSRSVQRGYFRKSAIEQLIDHNSVQKPRGKQIFSLVMLELWHRMFLDSSPVTVEYANAT